MRIKVAVLFDNLGPYHLARLRAASELCELLALEVAAKSGDYAWERDIATTPFERKTLLDLTSSNAVASELKNSVWQGLSDFRPQVVAIPGWASRTAHLALSWCIANRVPAILMSESTRRDEPRSWWKEAFKARLVGMFSAALAGGTPQRDYLVELSMRRDAVFLGYDAVDNDYFQAKAREARNKGESPFPSEVSPAPYFLASARFIEKKNLFNVLRAYARYRNLHIEVAATRAESSIPWNLVVVGDGPLRKELEDCRSTLGLCDHVHFPGFRQYGELPKFYAWAGAFIHASTSEQWGLVVNEAMACGLPVLVSTPCGCADDLVKDGVNGYRFDPLDTAQLARHMLDVSVDPQRLRQMGRASQEIIRDWGPKRFADGLMAASAAAIGKAAANPSLASRAVLGALTMRSI